MAGPMDHTAGNAGKSDAPESKLGHPTENQAKLDDSHHKMLADAGMLAAGGLAGGAAGAAAEKLAAQAAHKVGDSKSHLPDFELKQVNAAADQMVKSQGKEHSAADAVLQNSFLKDKPSGGEHYNEIYKALSDRVNQQTHGEQNVTSHVEHGRHVASMVANRGNYYAADKAQDPGKGYGDAKHGKLSTAVMDFKH